MLLKKPLYFLTRTRWSTLFTEYFVESKDDANHDDMLFFVRPPPTPALDNNSDNEDTATVQHQDPVFVLRKQSPPNILPPIAEVIMWKETFLLNLIVQMPCKLTVAVCRRRSKQQKQQQQHKGGMSVVRKHVSKRVYALPNKSRMDLPKGNAAGPPECSWPNIHYVIDDYEDMFEDMFIKKGEYLCVELSARIPIPSSGNDDDEAAFSKDIPVSISKQTADHDEKNNNVFSSVRSRLTSANSALGGVGGTGTYKVVLFQGAASFNALVDNYVHRLSSKNMLHRLRKPTYTPEFIMMRGPGGKGHAQVAITGRSNADELAELASRNASVISSPVIQPQQQSMASSLSNNWSKLPAVASPHMQPLSTINSTPGSPSLSAWLKRISLPSIAENLSQATSPPPPPKSLQASMTFVSIPWNSIIEDLLAFKAIS